MVTKTALILLAAAAKILYTMRVCRVAKLYIGFCSIDIRIGSAVNDGIRIDLGKNVFYGSSIRNIQFLPGEGKNFVTQRAAMQGNSARHHSVSAGDQGFNILGHIFGQLLQVLSLIK